MLYHMYTRCTQYTKEIDASTRNNLEILNITMKTNPTFAFILQKTLETWLLIKHHILY